MPQFTADSWRQCALCAAIALIAACSDRSSSPGASSASATPADAATSTQQQNATVAELLSGSGTPASPAADAPAKQEPPSPGGETGSDAAPAPDGDVEYARVVSVAPVTGPHRVCTNETVTEQRRPHDEHQVAGTLIGAIAGGVIGHQIGGGRG